MLALSVTVPAVATVAVPAPSSMGRATTSPVPVPVLDRFSVLPVTSVSGVALVAKVPAPLLLVMEPPLARVTTLPTLAPPAMSSVLAPSARVPLPALPLPVRRSMPLVTVVPPA